MAMRWRIAILLAIITTINYVDRSVFSVAAPVIREQFSINAEQYGWISFWFLLTYGAGQLISGPLIDRLGTKRAFSLAAALWSIATILHAAGRGFLSFLSFRALLGLAEAANFPAATKAVAEWFPTKERSSGVSIFLLGAGLGAIITPPATVLAIETIGWKWAFIIPGVLGLIWVWLWQRWYWLPEDHPGISASERALILEERSPQVSKESWVSLLRYKEFWGLMASRFVSDFPFYFFLFWLPQYLMDERGFNLRDIALFAWLPWVAADLGALTGGYLSSWLIRRGYSVDAARKIVIWLGALLVLVAIPAFSADYAMLALALICVAMFAIQIKGAVFFTLPSDLFPAAKVATVWGVFGAVGSLGAAILQAGAGYLIENTGYEPVFLIVGLAHIVSAALLMLFVPRIRQLEASRP